MKQLGLALLISAVYGILFEPDFSPRPSGFTNPASFLKLFERQSNREIQASMQMWLLFVAKVKKWIYRQFPFSGEPTDRKLRQ
jgi:hypothetical protein